MGQTPKIYFKGLARKTKFSEHLVFFAILIFVKMFILFRYGSERWSTKNEWCSQSECLSF